MDEQGLSRLMVPTILTQCPRTAFPATRRWQEPEPHTQCTHRAADGVTILPAPLLTLMDSSPKFFQGE